MFYVFTHTLELTDLVTLKKRVDLQLTVGVIHQVDVLFQDGCDHNVNVQIFQANYQIWPSNPRATMQGNATVISFREFYPLEHGLTLLHAMIWADEAIAGVEVAIQIGLLPKRVLQPLSFEELLAAATGL